MARTVLGRGLSALISTRVISDEIDFKQIPIKEISPNPNQPRHFIPDESFRELKTSIKQQGILQPLIVKEKEEGYEIIAGERRYQAALAAGIEQLPAVVKKVKNEMEGFELALIENIQRQDLSPLEEAQAYRYLLDDCGISQEKLAKHLGKSRSHIANLVRLLNLDQSVQQMLNSGALSIGHARVLVPLEAAKQKALAKKCIEEELSVRQIESLVNEGKQSNPIKSSSVSRTISADDFTLLEEQLSKKMGAQVNVKSSSGKGKIEISFSSYDELKKIKKKLL